MYSRVPAATAGIGASPDPGHVTRYRSPWIVASGWLDRVRGLPLPDHRDPTMQLLGATVLS